MTGWTPVPARDPGAASEAAGRSGTGSTGRPRYGPGSGLSGPPARFRGKPPSPPPARAPRLPQPPRPGGPGAGSGPGARSGPGERIFDAARGADFAACMVKGAPRSGDALARRARSRRVASRGGATAAGPGAVAGGIVGGEGAEAAVGGRRRACCTAERQGSGPVAAGHARGPSRAAGARQAPGTCEWLR